MSSWNFVYDKEFAYVYDPDHDERIDMSWDGEQLTITEGKLDIEGVIRLRKLLQAVERKAAKEKA